MFPCQIICPFCYAFNDGHTCYCYKLSILSLNWFENMHHFFPLLAWLWCNEDGKKLSSLCYWLWTIQYKEECPKFQWQQCSFVSPLHKCCFILSIVEILRINNRFTFSLTLICSPNKIHFIILNWWNDHSKWNAYCQS